jgi:hypothetical protein
MTDNELIRLFLPIIQAGLSAEQYDGVVTKQTNQPTAQGANIVPTVYFYKTGDHRYGFLKRIDTWDATTSIMSHEESQMYETKFTVQALVRQFPTTPYSYTASDLVNSVAGIMQSDATRETLAASDVGILRIQEITNPYFNDDRDQFEASPSFDFILTHRRTRITTDPVIDSFTYNIKRV